ncbi:uncharacterized protein LOC108034211 isoform X2 [Drosophila biarmipes]|uniref:uncharacterized protein LOC108034211 isoform X2 n=1 Tax=Drosophila biarmipes TaxID=125945 RepID=UPI001CDB28CB|nr:uncharacterized protein LOC108034211 isoform X2 [Drosophila biarmipes]
MRPGPVFPRLSMPVARHVWKDWKCTIKKKSIDKGWPHKHEPMSSTEEALAAILQFNKLTADQPDNNSPDLELRNGSSPQFAVQKVWEGDCEDPNTSVRPRKKIKIDSRRSTSSSEASGYRELSYRASESSKDIEDELTDEEYADDPLHERLLTRDKISERPIKRKTDKTSLRTPTEETSYDSSEDAASLKEIAGQLRALNETTRSATKSIMSMAARMCDLMERGLEERQQHNALLKKLLYNRK